MTQQTDGAILPSPRAGHPALRRALTLPLLTLYGLGVTVGAGIYVLIGAAAAEAGVHAPVSFLIAAGVVAFTAFSYAELATRFPVSAGEAAYVQAGFGARWLALAVGLMVALSGIVSASAVAIGAASYLTQLTGLAVPLLTVLVVLAMGLIAFWGIAESVTVAGVITVIEILGLLAVIGWSTLDGEPAVVPLSDLVPPMEAAAWTGIGAASLLAFFAFVGFEDMANVAEEVIDPVRAIPRAIVLTLLLATLLYVLTAAAVVTAIPLADLAGSAAPLALVFATAPPVIADGFALIAIVATVNGILIQMIMASRVIFGLADRRVLPEFLSRVSPRTRTPGPATALVVGIVILLTQALPIGALAQWTSQIVLSVFVVVNLALIRLKLRGVRAEGACFRVPLAVPVLGVVTSLGLFASALL